MKLSTKGRYGLQLMVDLGVHSKDKQVSLKSISERLGISESYFEQLIALLKKKKLVISVRGAQGGYYLAKSPEDISIGDILRALEGSLAPTECTCESNKEYHCDRCGINGEHCVTKSVWERIRDGINQVVDSIALHELIEDYERINQYAPDYNLFDI